jgi:surface protein
MFQFFRFRPTFRRPTVRFRPTDKNELMQWINDYCNGNRSKEPIGNWDVSHITDMSRLFFRKTTFNEPLNNWDVSNVTDMSLMFSGCKYFNQPLNTWNVSNVTNMSEIFSLCETFNQPLDQWNVSNVTNMNYMFNYCETFNQPLNNWNVSNVIYMSFMFNYCETFNQPLNNWNVSNVIYMGYMFNYCETFNQPLDTWNVSKVTNMNGMFKGCTSFRQTLRPWAINGSINWKEISDVPFIVEDLTRRQIDRLNKDKPLDPPLDPPLEMQPIIGRFKPIDKHQLSIWIKDYSRGDRSKEPIINWDVSHIVDMSELFMYDSSFNEPLNNWDVSNVTNMNNMFKNCRNFNQPLDQWNVSNVTTMQGTFEGCREFNQPLNNWNVSNVTSMRGMFANCFKFNQPLNTWKVSNVTNMNSMFVGCREFNQPLNIWKVSNVTNMQGMFYDCREFNQPLNNWNVSNVTNMINMFRDCREFNQPLNNWNVSNVTDMFKMFVNCYKYNQPLETWNVFNVTNMNSMFYDCREFNQPLNNWNVSNVTDMEGMFVNCYKYNQPLETWNVFNVTNMSYMFYNCKNFNQSLNNWNVSNVTNMEGMFGNCEQYNQPLDIWNVSNVTNMKGIFSNCRKFNQPLETWNVFNVTNMSYMFYNCESFNQPLNTWKINNLIKWENVSNQPLILNSHPTIIQLKLKDVRFPDNKEWNEISNYFYSNNPWLIHLETFEGIEYPVVTLPKGMMLYTYSTGINRNSEKFLFNLHNPSIDLQNSLKFFFPIPYAALAIFKHLDYCSIVTLSRNIRLLGLISPSPINHSYARDINTYYQQKYLKSGTFPFNHDICIDFKLKQNLNLEGYIAIPLNDSISHGKKFINENIKNFSKDFATQLILKSCISHHPTEKKPLNLYLLNSTYKTKVDSLQKVFGIPEIALSPFSNEILNEVKINYEKIFKIFNSTDTNKKQTTFNYKKLEIVSYDRVKFYLDSISSNIVESNQCPLFNLYLPNCNTREFPFYHRPKMYNELTLEDVNWLESYQTQTNVIAFNTILYEYFKITNKITGGSKKNKITNKKKQKTNKITGGSKKNKITNKKKQKTNKSLKKMKKGGKVNINNNLLSSVKSNKTIVKDVSNETIIPLKEKDISLLKSNETIIPLKENEVSLEKQSKKMICELSKIGIPIIYWQ